MFGIHFKDFVEFKKELGKIVFSDIEKKKELENIIICPILVEIEHLATKYEMNFLPFVIEAPTYFEVRDLEKGKNDFVILIAAPEDIRVKRILRRNPHLSKKEIYSRIHSQLEDDLKIPYSDLVIENIDLSELKKKIFLFLKKD